MQKWLALSVKYSSDTQEVQHEHHIEYEQEEDGRWITEVPEIPGVLTYGVTADEAMAKAQEMAFNSINTRAN